MARAVRDRGGVSRTLAEFRAAVRDDLASRDLCEFMTGAIVASGSHIVRKLWRGGLPPEVVGGFLFSVSLRLHSQPVLH